MAIVSCPECSKKLKVADTSVGKKVKCSCGNIFVAQTETAAVKKPVAAATIAPEKVFVACTECDAKLKVATTSLGKKMKCPKCASVFVASLPDDMPRSKPSLELDEEDAKPVAKGKGKPAKDDEMDDLFGFAQAEADPSAANGSYDDDPPVKSKGKAKKFDEEEADEDEDEPKPRGKAAKKPAKPARRGDDDEDEEKKPVYPSRVFLNIVVAFMLLGYLGALCVVFFNLYKVDDQMFALLNMEKPRVKVGPVLVNPLKKVDPPQKFTAPPAFDFATRQKQEKSWLDSYRKGVRPDVPNVVAILQPHQMKVVGIAFSPAKPMLAAISMEHEKEGIKLWDLSAAKPMKPIEAEIKGERPLAAFSPDGELLAIASGRPDSFMKVWKVADGSVVKETTLQKSPQALAFSSDGKRLTLLAREVGEAPDLKSWNVTGWNEHKLDVKPMTTGEYFLSPDGNQLLAFDSAGKLTSHDLATNFFKIARDTKSVIQPQARITPDGRFLANPNPDTDNASSLQMIDLSSGDVKIIAEEKDKIERIQFSPDVKYVLYEVAGDHKLVEIETKKLRWSLTAEIDAITFSPGGVFVARTDMGSIHLMALDEMIASEPKTEKKVDDKKVVEKKAEPWDKRLLARQKAEQGWLTALAKSGPATNPPGVLTVIEPAEPRIVAVAFSPAAPLLATCTKDDDKESVTLWDLKNAKAIKSIPVKVKDFWPRLAFSPDGMLLAMTSWDDQYVKVWDTADGVEVKSFPLKKAPVAVVFSPNGARLMVGMNDATGSAVQMWNVADWTEHKHNVKADSFTWNVFSPDGEFVLEIADKDTSITVHDLATGQTKKHKGDSRLKLANRPSACASPDGRSVAFADTDDKGAAKLYLMDLETGTVEALADAKLGIDQVRFTPDGKFLHYTIASGGAHHLHEIAAKKERGMYPQPIVLSTGGVLAARLRLSPGTPDAIHVQAFEELLAGAKKVDDKKVDDKKVDDKKVDDKKVDDKKVDDKKVDDKKVDDKKVDDKKNIKEKSGQNIRDDTQAGKPIVEVSLDFTDNCAVNDKRAATVRERVGY